MARNDRAWRLGLNTNTPCSATQLGALRWTPCSALNTGSLDWLDTVIGTRHSTPCSALNTGSKRHSTINTMLCSQHWLETVGVGVATRHGTWGLTSTVPTFHMQPCSRFTWSHDYRWLIDISPFTFEHDFCIQALIPLSKRQTNGHPPHNGHGDTGDWAHTCTHA
jgi:hypothetical protein